MTGKVQACFTPRAATEFTVAALDVDIAQVGGSAFTADDTFAPLRAVA